MILVIKFGLNASDKQRSQAKMSADPVRGSRPLLLSWSEAPQSPLQQACVDLIDAHSVEAVIRSHKQVAEKTRVYLSQTGYIREGIVLSCKSDDNHFILAVCMLDDLHPRATEPDPGCLVVEDFLTEEQEERLLSELEG